MPQALCGHPCSQEECTQRLLQLPSRQQLWMAKQTQYHMARNHHLPHKHRSHNRRMPVSSCPDSDCMSQVAHQGNAPPPSIGTPARGLLLVSCSHVGPVGTDEHSIAMVPPSCCLPSLERQKGSASSCADRFLQGKPCPPSKPSRHHLAETLGRRVCSFPQGRCMPRESSRRGLQWHCLQGLYHTQSSWALPLVPCRSQLDRGRMSLDRTSQQISPWHRAAAVSSPPVDTHGQLGMAMASQHLDQLRKFLVVLRCKSLLHLRYPARNVPFISRNACSHSTAKFLRAYLRLYRIASQAHMHIDRSIYVPLKLFAWPEELLAGPQVRTILWGSNVSTCACFYHNFWLGWVSRCTLGALHAC